MVFSLSDILLPLVIFQLLFISFFLYSKETGKRTSNILLASFFLAICLNLADTFLLIKQVYFQFPAWALWGSGTLLAGGPLLFFYTQSVIYKDFQFTKRRLMQFTPFLLLFIISEISYLAAGREKQIEILNNIINRKIPPAVYIVSSVIYIHFFAYLFASFRLIKRYRAAAVNQYSDSQRATLNWLRSTIIFFFVLIVLSAVNSYLSYTSYRNLFFPVMVFTIFLLLLYIVLVLFKASRNPEIFSALKERELEEAVQTAKYAGSGLTDNEKKRILANLEEHMQNQKPWLEPELTLDELAKQLSVKPKALSQVINELLQQNFFEYINNYRIEEAKRLLTNPEDKKITVLEVLYEVGFNSKSSFNTLFKKHTGLTPSEFKRENMQ